MAENIITKISGNPLRGWFQNIMLSMRQGLKAKTGRPIIVDINPVKASLNNTVSSCALLYLNLHNCALSNLYKLNKVAHSLHVYLYFTLQ